MGAKGDPEARSQRIGVETLSFFGDADVAAATLRTLPTNILQIVSGSGRDRPQRSQC